MIYAKFQNPKLPKTIFVEKTFDCKEDFKKWAKSAEKHGTKCIEFYDTRIEYCNENEMKREV